MTQFSRRSIAKGASWSVPIIATTSMVPATAASDNCQPTITYGGGYNYHWGIVNNSAKTTQVANMGAGQVDISNLPPNVTVTSIVISHDILRRDGQDSQGPGMLFAANPAATFSGMNSGFTPSTVAEAKRNLTTDGISNYNITAIYPTSGSGFDPLVSASNGNTVNFNGTTATAWNLTYNWSASRNKLSNTYVNNGTCRNFTTGPSGRYNITYKNMTGNTDSAVRYVQLAGTVTATLSNGNVISKSFFLQL